MEPNSSRLLTAASLEQRLREQVPTFLDQVETKLPFVKDMCADHVCYRIETQESYDELVKSLRADTKSWKLLIESMVGGRPIATFELSTPIRGGHGRKISVIEIPSPKAGSPYNEGLEHVEFVLTKASGEPYARSPANDNLHQSAFENFMTSHDNLNWSSKAKSKDINPDISVKVELESFGLCSVKFHLMPLAEVIEYEKACGLT